MHPVQTSLLIFTGAGVGANARYWIGVAIAAKFEGALPLSTLLVNVSGSFLLGLLLAVLAKGHQGQWAQLLFGVGLLGGYTTFSTFSVEMIQFFTAKTWLIAAAYLFASIVGCLLAAWAGWSLGR